MSLCPHVHVLVCPWQGLGRREDGIAEAIRVKVKCDTAGVGHDAAEPFTFHWWDHVFNKAAANIAVEAGQQGGGISNKKPRKAGKSGSLLYGRFVKVSMWGTHSTQVSGWGVTWLDCPLLAGAVEQGVLGGTFLAGEIPVLAARGHCRGARHGLTMSAKLARLEEQERAFLASYRYREQQQEPLDSSQRKKKKRKQSRHRADPEVPDEEQEEVLEEETVKRKNQGPSREEELTGEEEVVRRKKKKKKKVTELCEEEEISGEEEKVKKKRKKKKKLEPSTEEEVVEEEGKAANRKKRKQQEEDKEEVAETDVPIEDTDGPNLGHSPIKKRKKKKKREPE
uniref:G patch domain-containing protein 4 n=1 Tax=Malurus cyaneus samueli TaxID=2593467 RepID=A0A8C5U210_9PASS